MLQKSEGLAESLRLRSGCNQSRSRARRQARHPGSPALSQNRATSAMALERKSWRRPSCKRRYADQEREGRRAAHTNEQAAPEDRAVSHQRKSSRRSTAAEPKSASRGRQRRGEEMDDLGLARRVPRTRPSRCAPALRGGGGSRRRKIRTSPYRWGPGRHRRQLQELIAAPRWTTSWRSGASGRRRESDAPSSNRARAPRRGSLDRECGREGHLACPTKIPTGSTRSKPRVSAVSRAPRRLSRAVVADARVVATTASMATTSGRVRRDCRA